MTTRLSSNVINMNRIFPSQKFNFEKKFYFNENPEEVLRKIIVDYPVRAFNDLWIRLEDHLVPIPPKKNALSPNYSYFKGFEILDTELSPRDFNDLENFDSEESFYLIKRKNSPDMKKVMNSLIEDYLINTHTISPGSKTLGINNREISSEKRIIGAKFYLDERKEEIYTDTENKLENILKYGKAVFGKNFGIDYIQNVGREILKKFPKETSPTQTYFANLNPDNYYKR